MSSSWNKEDNEAEASDNEEDEGEYKTGEDKIIFLVDARESMKGKNSKGEVFLRNCLQIVVEVMKSKIVADDNSSIGLTLFGTVHKEPGGSTDNVFTVFPLEVPNAINIRKVQEYIDNGHKFASEVGSLSSAAGAYVSLKEALWVCSQEFHTKSLAKKLSDYRRVWLFTNDDNPNGHSQSEQEKIIKVAKDCSETGIEISLWHMNRVVGQAFNTSAFYEGLLHATKLSDSAVEAAGDEADEVGEGIDHRMRGGGDEGFDIMLASVRRKNHRKRKLRTMTLSLGNDHPPESFVTVTLYRLVSATKKSLHKWLYAKTNEPLVVSSKYISGETGESLDESAITTYLEISGARVEFSATEMKAIKSCNFQPIKSEQNEVAVDIDNSGSNNSSSSAAPDITVLFCAPASSLAVDANIDCAYFLFPDNNATMGSTAFFTVFLNELHNKSLVVFVKFRRTKNGAPRLACLIPQLEQLDEDGVQTQAAGFHVIVLPFMEEVRRNPTAAAVLAAKAEILDTTASTEAEVVQCAVNLIRASTLDDNFEYFRDIENPSLQQFHSVLQAVALSFDGVEWTPDMDKLHPSAENIEAFANQAAEFKAASGLVDESGDQPAPKKRAAAGGATASRAKKVKDEDEPARGGQDLSKKTVAELKEMCKARGLPVSGAKAALIERLEE